MTSADIAYLPEQPAHDDAIEALNAAAFGPGRFTRAAYRIREDGPHDRGLSFVAMQGETLVASVRMTPVAAGAGRAMLLGPLAVSPALQGQGIGRRLVQIAVAAAHKARCPAVMLVGDEPYYGPLGFRLIPHGQVAMPRPTDLNRILVCELVPGAAARLVGMVGHAAIANVARQPVLAEAS